MKEFVIRPEDDGARLSRWLEKTAPGLPQSGLYKAIRTKRIKRNGKRCAPADRLAAGDTVELWLDDACFAAAKPASRPDFMNASRELTVLYEDAGIAVLYKPVGLNTHPVKGEYGDNLVARFLRFLYEKGEYAPGAAFTPALCNRLDRNTAGLVVAGKTRAAAEAVNAMIRAGELHKEYRAVVAAPPPADGVYDAFLYKDEAKNRVSVSDQERPGYKPIRTGFRTLAQRGGLSLLAVTLYTGRPHQIRAHLAHLGAPVLGDPKYGDAAENRRRGEKTQLLAAYALTFGRDGSGLLAPLEGRSFALPQEPFRERFR